MQHISCYHEVFLPFVYIFKRKTKTSYLLSYLLNFTGLILTLFFSADLFIAVAEAFKVLTDSEAKAAFDKVLQAREKAKLRTQQYDAKRKKFKEGLTIDIKL